ncbi:accessory Sec system protein Asp1 [Aerococcus urinaeequi]|uniref:accessory Sec system protein Asp1 n=1 Tax=Aerococcus urinaeequi TaxID=51665 RepID=UPI003D6BB3F9
MYYFVPAWYQEKLSLAWQYISKEIEFDDTVNQIRMFDAQSLSTELLVLNYLPNLRTLLNRQQLLKISCWSLFDELQGIEQKKLSTIQPFNYKELNWPENIQFITTPFVVIAMKDNRVYARIYFNEAGNVLWIDCFEKKLIESRYVIDDRGFVSSIQKYNQGKHLSTIFLNLIGEKQFIYSVENGTFEISENAKIRHKLKERFYDSKSILIEAVLNTKKKEFTTEDTIVIAASNEHNRYFLKNEVPGKKVLSFFSERNNQKAFIESESINNIDLFVADSDTILKNVTQLNGHVPATIISPYDSRLNLGVSQEVKELNVWINIDNIQIDLVYKIGELMVKEILRNKDIRVIFASYNVQNDQNSEIAQFVETLNDRFTSEESFDEKINSLNVDTVVEEYFLFRPIREELTVISSFSTVRLVIDLSENPHLYTQIAGISAGIPQINQRETPYVKHRENGYIITSIGDLPQAIHYYLDTLKNWNSSLVYAVERIAENNSGELVKKWATYLEMG